MSKRRLQGIPPDPNAACGRKLFGNIAERSALTFCQHCRKVYANILTKSGLTNLSDPIFLDLWQDCRKSTEPLTGFGNVAEPDFFCLEGGLQYRYPRFTETEPFIKPLSATLPKAIGVANEQSNISYLCPHECG
jgi:hypothetical protein